MFVPNARPHSETSVSPYVLKFDTTDGILFQPDQHERYQGTNQYIQHQAPNPPISTQYQRGDFLLFSIPKMSRASKLSTPNFSTQ